jgi:hypothetical protein
LLYPWPDGAGTRRATARTARPGMQTADTRKRKEVVMGKFTKVMTIVLALAMVVAWTVWASDQVATGESIEITGTVLKGGKLQDEEGQQYTLVQDEVTLQLLSHVDEKVEVRGTLIERQEGDQVLKIETYQVVNP